MYPAHRRVHNPAWLVLTSRRLLQKIPDLESAGACSSCQGRIAAAQSNPSRAVAEGMSAAHGDFALTCIEHHRTTYWHNAVRDTLARVCQKTFGHSCVRVEPRNEYPGANMRQPDVVVELEGQAAQVIDVRTCTPTQSHLGPQTCLREGWSLAQGEKNKRRDWATTIGSSHFRENSHVFTALCVDEGGGIGDETRKLCALLDMHSTQRDAGDGSPSSSFLSHLLTELRAASLLGVGRLLSSHINARHQLCSDRFRKSLHVDAHNPNLSPPLPPPPLQPDREPPDGPPLHIPTHPSPHPNSPRPYSPSRLSPSSPPSAADRQGTTSRDSPDSWLLSLI